MESNRDQCRKECNGCSDCSTAYEITNISNFSTEQLEKELNDRNYKNHLKIQNEQINAPIFNEIKRLQNIILIITNEVETLRKKLK